jgi:hypothetical protein
MIIYHAEGHELYKTGALREHLVQQNKQYLKELITTQIWD